jgi:hypothetical protein
LSASANRHNAHHNSGIEKVLKRGIVRVRITDV